MAREFIDGFEAGYATSGWYNSNPSNCPVTTAPSGMDGSYAQRVDTNYEVSRIVTARDEYYVSFLYYGNNADHSKLWFFDNGTTRLGCISLSTQYIKAYRGNAANLIATGTFYYTMSTTIHIEIYYKPKTDGTGRFVVKVNGLTDIDYTGQTSNNALQIDNMGMIGYGNSYFDNAIADSSSWIGLTKIKALAPNAAGDTTQWTPSTGNNYDCVNEIPYSDTDYVSTNTNDNIDIYNIASLTGSIDNIKGVVVQARAKFDGAPTPTNLAMVVKTNSTVYAGSDQAVASSYMSFSYVWENNPNTSSAWSTSDIDSLQIGIKARA